MKGKILNIGENEGLIIADNDQRYKFSLDEWKEQYPPKKGDEVDFEIEKDRAKEIFSLEPKNCVNNKEILKTAGLLGGLGSIGILLSWVPFLGAVFSLTGLILLFIAIKKISDINPEKQIFKNFLYATLLPFVIGVVLAILLAILLPRVMQYADETTVMLTLWIFIGTPIFIIVAIYLKKTFIGIYEVTQNQTFKTCAEMFFWGELLSIVIIGIFLVFVTWIVAAIAFFSLKKD